MSGRLCRCGAPVMTRRGIPVCGGCRTERQRASWRRWKAAKRAATQETDRQKRRDYYLSNVERLRERQRRYYWNVWKLRNAGVLS